jgi:hypothetical protein
MGAMSAYDQLVASYDDTFPPPGAVESLDQFFERSRFIFEPPDGSAGTGAGEPEDAPAPPRSDEPPDRGAPPIGDNEPPLIFRPTPFEPRDPSNFPRRDFLYGFHYVRKYVSATIAPGGVGKSSLALVEAIAMASGTPLLRIHFKHALNVWYSNGEDPREETERRTLAICKHYKIDSLKGRFFFDSGRDLKLIVAEMASRGIKIALPVKDALIAALKRLEIDVLVIDPFVKAHRITENDNVLMDAVATVFAGDRKRCQLRSRARSPYAQDRRPRSDV